MSPRALAIHGALLLACCGATAWGGSDVTFRGLGFIAPNDWALTSACLSPDASYVYAVGMVDAPGFPGGMYRIGPSTVPQLLSFGGVQSTTLARATSWNGTIAVGTLSYSEGSSSAFRWTELDGLTPLLSSFANASAVAMSYDGSVVVGWGGELGLDAALVWMQQGTPLTIPLAGDTNAASDVSGNGLVVVGTTSTYPPHARADTVFKWTQAGGVSLLPLAPGSWAALNPIVSGDGLTIVGWANVPSTGYRPFHWRSATGSVLLPRPDCVSGWLHATGISHDGNLVVGFNSNGNLGEAVLWVRGLGRRISSILGDVVPPGWRLSAATAISADGHTILGRGVDPMGRDQLWIAQIPSICGQADIATLGGSSHPDGLLTLDDVVVFLTAFFQGTTLLADIASVGGAPEPDCALTADDVVAFLGAFFAGCP